MIKLESLGFYLQDNKLENILIQITKAEES